MAVFDVALQRVCVRVVYDGPAHAGKTTNVRQLGALFPSRHATEVISPSELSGRTLSFDWLQIRAGVLAGFPLVCQVISVPGQSALTARRRHLLETADVIVFVADSADAEIEPALASLALLESVPPEVPILLQANKQDQVGAVSGAALARALKREGATVIEAIATDGVGVVDTFVAAVRAVSHSIQQRLAAAEVRIPVRSCESHEELLAELSTRAIDAEAAAEMFLQHASAMFEQEPSAPAPVPNAQPVVAADEPPLPRADVPPGHVWPAHVGRKLLATLGTPTARTVEADIVTVRFGDLVLRTSSAERFEDPERGRAAIVRAARHWSQLGTLLSPETVLALQEVDGGVCFLWTMQRMQAETPCDVEALARSVCALLAVATRNAFGVELRTSAFANGHYVGRLLADPSGNGASFSSLLDELASLRVVDAFLEAFDAELERLPADDRDAVGNSIDRVGAARRAPTVRPAPMSAA